MNRENSPGLTRVVLRADQQCYSPDSAAGCPVPVSIGTGTGAGMGSVAGVGVPSGPASFDMNAEQPIRHSGHERQQVS